MLILHSLFYCEIPLNNQLMIKSDYHALQNIPHWFYQDSVILVISRKMFSTVAHL